MWTIVKEILDFFSFLILYATSLFVVVGVYVTSILKYPFPLNLTRVQVLDNSN